MIIIRQNVIVAPDLQSALMKAHAPLQIEMPDAYPTSDDCRILLREAQECAPNFGFKLSFQNRALCDRAYSRLRHEVWGFGVDGIVSLIRYFDEDAIWIGRRS